MKLKFFLLFVVFLSATALIFSQDIDPKLQNAEAFVEKEMFNEAIDIYLEILRDSPKSVDLNYDLAWAYLSNYDWDNAIKYFEKVLEINPQYARAYSHIARAYYEMKDYETAMAKLSLGFAITDTVPHLYMTRGLVHQMQGNSNDALVDFNKAIELDSKDPDYYIVRAGFNIEQSYPALAYSDLSEAIKLVPDNPEYYYYRAYVLMNANMLEDAMFDINKCIELDSENASYYNLKSSIYQFANDLENAEKCILKSIEIDNSDYMAWVNLGDLYFMLSRMDEFCVCYTNSLEYISSDLADPKQYVTEQVYKYCNKTQMSYYFIRALKEYNDANYEQCIAIIDSGLLEINESSVLENLKATCLLTKDQFDEASALFELSLEHSDMLEQEVVSYYRVELRDGDDKLLADSYKIKSYIGICISEIYNGAIDGAANNIKKAIDLADNIEVFDEREVLYNIRGIINIEQGDFEAALADFDIAISHNNSYSYAKLNIALIKILSSCKYKSFKIDYLPEFMILD